MENYIQNKNEKFEIKVESETLRFIKIICKGIKELRFRFKLKNVSLVQNIINAYNKLIYK